MDRNLTGYIFKTGFCAVALRKESVDRNWQSIETPDSVSVALRKESVDRNVAETRTQTAIIPSLSARRAWIEMLIRHYNDLFDYVALRKESVDRNRFAVLIAVV